MNTEELESELFSYLDFSNSDLTNSSEKSESLTRFFHLVVQNEYNSELLARDSFAELWHKFIINCSDDYILSTLNNDNDFWYITNTLFECFTIVQFGIVLCKLLTSCITDKSKNKKKFLSMIDKLFYESKAIPVYLSMWKQFLARPKYRVLLNQMSTLHRKCTELLFATDANLATKIALNNFKLFDIYNVRSTFADTLDLEDVSVSLLYDSLISNPYDRRLFDGYNLIDCADYIKKKYYASLNTIRAPAKDTKPYENIAKYIDISDLTLLQAFDTIIFFEDSNLTFKKAYCEHLLFGSSKFLIRKAMIRTSEQVDEYLESLKDDLKETLLLNINRSKIFYVIMDRLLNMWIDSNAKTEKDLDSLLELIIVIIGNTMKKKKKSVSYYKDIESHFEELKKVSYKVARKWQLNIYKEKHYSKWSDRVVDFDKLLSKQVYEYVRHQRLLQLQKGNWAYTENPINSTNINNPKLAFIVLSANQNEVLIREFDVRPEDFPQVTEKRIFVRSDKDLNLSKNNTKVVRLTDITELDVQQIKVDNNIPNITDLVNLIQKSVYLEVKIYNKKNEILIHLFFDNKEATYICMDGIRMISPYQKLNESLSQNTKDQINTLIDVRKNVQLINLSAESSDTSGGLNNDPFFNGDLDDSENDDDIYNFEVLKNLTSDFYYG